MKDNNVSVEVMASVDSELVEETNGINGKDVAKTVGVMAIGAAVFEGGKFLVKKAVGAIKKSNVKETVKAKLPKLKKAKTEDTDQPQADAE